MPSLQHLKRLTCIRPEKQVACQFDIDIDGHHETKIYTTGSTVQGSVRLTTQHQTTFQSIQVSFRGTSSTRQVSQYGQPSRSHTFLNIQIPMSDETLPSDRILRAGKSYNIPFLFKIPQDLSLHACNHRSPVVRERHLVPPPSLGSWTKNDFTDGSTSIEYVIQARLLLGTEGKLVDQNVSLKVIPIFPEQPPIDVASLNTQYCLSQTKTIRRNLVGAKEGTLKVSTTQPRPVVLHLGHLQTSDSELAINLEYAPSSSGSTPPEIRVKGAAIEAITSFWTGPVGYLPDHDETLPSAICPVAPWTNSYPLPLRGLGAVKWEKVLDFGSQAESERRASEPIPITRNHPSKQSPSYTTASSIDIPYNQPELPTYKATLTQPFSLPTEKLLFLPTFHSCMVSRSYRIRITFAARAQGSTMSLIVPLQITSEGRATTNSPRLPLYYDDEYEPVGDSPPPYRK
ncbi:uncharacterized protein FIESC28_08234 [Fusarium coffeatum]|uniref:Arrestin-like N-terminal domain-containing protein n=1 Tax=Fusarium coffeatum TaxID=231269 RepID=A0A366R9N5_9HYPO|nr:uncharacterized protein FIESC28_08234 [Fusarium coffeatum]RBR13268.1 hypothetical protein FIESC28_08234 [Fusarium coffeatum]